LRSAVWDWFLDRANRPWWQGKRVADVGCLDVNGNPRALFDSLGAAYLGVDMRPGPNVDAVCRAEALVETFGAGAFDAVVCVDAAEHFEDWRTCVSQLKRACKPGGLLFFASVPPGFPRHEHPGDYWRFTGQDLRAIFADCELLAEGGNVCLLCRKPVDWSEGDLGEIALATAT